MNKFIHLDVKSDFSFWQGASKIEHLVSYCSELGMTSVALSDTNNLFGGFDFSKKAVAKGVLPIIASELFLGYKKESSKTRKTETKKGAIIVLAQNETGYQNLCALVSKANSIKDNKEDAGILPTKELITHKDGLIVLSGGEQGILYSMLKDDMIVESNQLAQFLQSVFKDKFYIQVSRNIGVQKDKEVELENKLLDIAFNKENGFRNNDGDYFNGIPIIATAPVRYTKRDNHEIWEILRALDEGRHLHFFEGEMNNRGAARYHMLSPEEMQKLFSDIPEAYENACEIGNRFAFKVSERKPILPAFDTGANRNEVDELRHQSEIGLEQRLEKEGVTDPDELQTYKERLDFELGVIENMGFPGYLLIVSDFMKWSRSQGIPVGPGRGSGAGSLVAWSLFITDLNPFRFGLLFERFLNPDRVSMPDFDIDFCQDRREDVIRYVADKYGIDHVAQIANFGEIKSKTAIKDAGRIIVDSSEGGFGFNEVNELTSMIPKKEDSAEPRPLAEAYHHSPELAKKIDSSDKMRLLFNKAQKIEGLYRSQGLHAAGIVIADRPMHELAPIGWDEDTGLPVTQFNMKAAESVGLVKFDFLGLKTLSIIQKTIESIKEFQNKDIDIETIPFDDPLVYEMLADGKSIGVFQFESAGMQKVLKQVQTTRIEDLIAVNALYRPGPMEMIPHYASCKRGEEEPSYPDPIDKTKPFLEETFGILVYQEQVMQVAQVVAGYSLGQADILRRAMGKKIKSEMDAQKEMFIKGAVARGTSKKAAEDLFHHIEKFASYGFNKSHAAAYAVIAYRTAWLKRHYPVEFFSALLSYETQKPERMALIRDDMAIHPDRPIQLLPPDINRSSSDFRPEKNEKEGYHIRFGLNAIKSVSGDLPYLAKEQKKGPFKDLTDFYQRAGYNMNKSQLEKLAEAGAFDTIEPVRSHSFTILNWLSKNWNPENQKNDLFPDSKIVIPTKLRDGNEWGDISDREFRSVGFWFGKHPIDSYIPRILKSPIKRKSSHSRHMHDSKAAQKKGAYVCGLIEDARIRESANGRTYVLARVAEQQDSYFMMFFNSRGPNAKSIFELLDQLNAAKRQKTPVVIECDIVLKGEDEDILLFGSKVHNIEDFLAPYRGVLHITLSSENLILSNEEYNRINENPDNNDTRQQVYFSAMRRKATELNSLLNEVKVDDNHPGAVPIEVEVRVSGFNVEAKRKSGKYILSPALENRIKSLDGISSFREIVDNKEEIPLQEQSAQKPYQKTAQNGKDTENETPPFKRRKSNGIYDLKKIASEARESYSQDEPTNSEKTVPKQEIANKEVQHKTKANNLHQDRSHPVKRSTLFSLKKKTRPESISKTGKNLEEEENDTTLNM